MNIITLVFIVFSLIYITNLLIHLFNNDSYYLSFYEVLLFYVSSAIIPFLAISSFPLKEEHLKYVFSILVVSGLIFSIFTILFYGNFIGQIDRLSSNSINKKTISPLSISYTSTLLIGLIVSYLRYNKTNIKYKVILIITGVLALVPFFLGVSRGSIIALFLPFVLMIIVRRKEASALSSFLMLILSVSFFYYLDFLTGSNFKDRFSDIVENIKNNDNSVARIFIWKSSFFQFLESPIFGGKLAMKKWTVYPHNILLETLQFTGIIGFIPFIILLAKGVQISIKIFLFNKKYSWVAIMFIQSLIQRLFSGAIYNANWYWLSLALLIAFSFHIQHRESQNNLDSPLGHISNL